MNKAHTSEPLPMIPPGILRAVEAELREATADHPGWPTDPIHAAGIVAEEAGELVQAAIDYTYEGEFTRGMHDEAVQVAAMALRFLAHLDGYQPRPSPGVDQ